MRHLHDDSVLKRGPVRPPGEVSTFVFTKYYLMHLGGARLIMIDFSVYRDIDVKTSFSLESTAVYIAL